MLNYLFFKLRGLDIFLQFFGHFLSCFFSLGKIYAENILLDINDHRTIKAEYSDVSNFTLLDWGKWTSKNYSDLDVLTNTIVSYTDSYASTIKFDKSEIIDYEKSTDGWVLEL